MGKFTVIYDDEDVIGQVSEIKKCFMQHLAEITMDGEVEMGEKTNKLRLVAELIDKLENESEKTIVKVSYNPMGTFNIYHIQGWEE